MVDTVELLSAVLALVAVTVAVAVVVVRLMFASSPAGVRIGNVVERWRNHATLAIAGTAMTGSLYFSEVANYFPCRLCWFQRIAMYPIAVVAAVAVFRRDRHARWYAIPLAAVGIVISTYHVLIEQGVLSDAAGCAASGPSCADIWFEEFGFITLAVMAFAGFAAILSLNLITFRTSQEDS